MDALEQLKFDHKKVSMLFDEYEMARDGRLRLKQAIAGQIFRELQIHSQIEEEVFYPALEAVLSSSDIDRIHESLEEHRIIRTLIEQLELLQLGDPEFDFKFDVLRGSVEQHAEEEEWEILPLAEAAIPNLEALGERMDDLRRELSGIEENMSARRAAC
jgi:Hemerythrin HHE cation binding domain